jgi:hypothetical protein
MNASSEDLRDLYADDLVLISDRMEELRVSFNTWTSDIDKNELKGT